MTAAKRLPMREEAIRHLVIGSGAAGYRAAIALQEAGLTDLALLTDRREAGTSRNTGSDKQTYYKLSLAGDTPDSVLKMARDLTSGGNVDGDNALAEAALSARGFFYLTELGVPFPCTEFGEYMGYQTDHDTGRRATSAGPYTSRLMTECLERRAAELHVRVLDHMPVIRLLTVGGRIRAVLAIDQTEWEMPSFVLIWCESVILATGGPAGLYLDSVYPASQQGMSGMVYECGAHGQNLTEWQFGMASLYPRWNVSGTYMQCMPRFLSTAEDGSDEREFLAEYYRDPAQLLTMIFLKGYQWPFDVRKTEGGSSVIDLLVYRERVLRRRRVYLDFTQNPGGRPVPFAELGEEARAYLTAAGALLDTPYERLWKMNAPAVSFYLDHGVDLKRERLEIAVSAQHNNGGIAVDANWESHVRGLYVIGEAAGTHGVTRPGGTALNAGQVGALRAAAHIRRLVHQGRLTGEPLSEGDLEVLRKEAEEFAALPQMLRGQEELAELRREEMTDMSAIAGMIRNPVKMRESLLRVKTLLAHLPGLVRQPTPQEYLHFYRLRDMLITKRVYLAAMLDYVEAGGESRGSALYTDSRGIKPAEELPELFRCSVEEQMSENRIQEVYLQGCKVEAKWRPARPIPQSDYFFEREWEAYRERET